MLPQFDPVANEQFWLNRLTAAQSRLAAIDSAILLVLNGAQSYSLNSGQTIQMVTRATLESLKNMKNDTENDVAIYTARVYGTGVIHGKFNAP